MAEVVVNLAAKEGRPASEVLNDLLMLASDVLRFRLEEPEAESGVIPLNQGICGAAASSGQTVVVDDVNKDSRYLACSLETKSEIVVPVFAHGKVVGELDIDSHFPAAFTSEHQALVQHCAQLVGEKLETFQA